jgi:hypothetical protein
MKLTWMVAAATLALGACGGCGKKKEPVASQERVLLPDPEGAARDKFEPARVEADAAPPAVPITEADLATVKRGDATHFELDAALLDKLVADPKAMGAVQLVPESKDGAPAGIRVSGIEPGSNWERFGFKDGDVIKTVAGMPLVSPERSGHVLKRIQMSRPLIIELVRAGQPVHMEFRVK